MAAEEESLEPHLNPAILAWIIRNRDLPPSTTGYQALFMGHSFFQPFADGIEEHALRAGLTDHSDTTVFAGGESGAPLAIWELDWRRELVQAELDSGQVELFGMTYHPSYPTVEGYRNWVNYALSRNPDTRIFIGVPWETHPSNQNAEDYLASWHDLHPGIHSLIDTLRSEFPGTVFYCIPYGQGAGVLYSMFETGNLPDVQQLVGPGRTGIFSDSFGHAADILVELGELVWLQAIYGVELGSYPFAPDYLTDLKAVAAQIMREHDPAYDAP